MTNPVSLPSFVVRTNLLPSLTICPTIGPTDLLHPSPAQPIRTFKVLLIYFPKCQIFITVPSYAPHVEFCHFIT